MQLIQPVWYTTFDLKIDVRPRFLLDGFIPVTKTVLEME